MAIPAEREQIDNGAPGGSRLNGNARQVIDGGGTATTLTTGQSGAMCLFGTAGGQAYTLPAISSDDVGMQFEFFANITGTGTYSVATSDAATFLVGAIDSSSTTVAQGGDTFVADGTADLNFTADSDLTGRLVGTKIHLTAISTTQWAIGGMMMGVGTLATPF